MGSGESGVPGKGEQVLTGLTLSYYMGETAQGCLSGGRDVHFESEV